MEDRFVFLQAHAAEHRVDAFGAENTHQVVLQRQEEFRCARIALTARATTQLVIDAAGFMAFGGDDVQAACSDNDLFIVSDFRFDARFDCFLFGLAHRFIGFARDQHFSVPAKHDVGAATGHVGGDSNSARLACLRDDLCFLLVVAGVEHLMRNFFFFQQSGKLFGFLNRHRADQHRLLACMAFFDQR